MKCEDYGQPELKGVATPLTLYRVVKENDAHSRFEVVVRKGLTPLIGREHELGLLQDRWDRAQNGDGQVVLLSGEPGIGKSRRRRSSHRARLLTDGAPRIEFRCSAYHQNSAFYPILTHLQRLLAFCAGRCATGQAPLNSKQLLAQYHFPQPDTFSLLAALLSLPHPDEVSAADTESAETETEDPRGVSGMAHRGNSEKAAVYCAWEDLHWADPSTLEVLTLFLGSGTHRAVVGDPDLSARVYATLETPLSHASHLTLNRLGRPQVEAMVEQVTGGKTLPQELIQQIVDKDRRSAVVCRRINENSLGVCWVYRSLLSLGKTRTVILTAGYSRGPCRMR